MTDRIRVVVVRGHQLTPWELGPWEELPADRFSVACLETRSNLFDASSLGLERIRARALRDLFPAGRLFDIAVGVARDRYLGLGKALAGADIVHAEELSFWFAADAAEHRDRGYKLVQTVWETLPLLRAYRNREARANRERVLAATDLFLAATDRAKRALLLEGVPEERIELCPPGIDTERFARARRPDPPPAEHVILSPGRLVWEKGHHDVLRAVGALVSGLVPHTAAERPRVLFVGSGPEEGRLRQHAVELGLGHLVEFASVPYDRMPDLYARASCVVLASLSSAGCELPPLSGRYRCFWEEQFGMVLAEAMAAGLPIVASRSGAIPEVAQGAAEYFPPGDWPELARLLAEGPLARPPATRVEHPPELVDRYSTAVAAERLAAAYDRLLAA